MSKKWLDVIKLVQRGTFQKKYFLCLCGWWHLANLELWSTNSTHWCSYDILHYSQPYIFSGNLEERKAIKKQEKIKSMELVGCSVIQHTVLKITFLKSICSTCGAPGTHLRSTLPGDCPNPLHRSRANMWRTVITFSTESSKSTRSTLQIHYSSYKNTLETDLV